MYAGVQKHRLYQLTPPGCPCGSIPGTGYSRKIEFWGSFEAHLHMPLVFSFGNTLISKWAFIVFEKIWFLMIANSLASAAIMGFLHSAVQSSCHETFGFYETLDVINWSTIWTDLSAFIYEYIYGTHWRIKQDEHTLFLLRQYWVGFVFMSPSFHGYNRPFIKQNDIILYCYSHVIYRYSDKYQKKIYISAFQGLGR